MEPTDDMFANAIQAPELQKIAKKLGEAICDAAEVFEVSADQTAQNSATVRLHAGMKCFKSDFFRKLSAYIAAGKITATITPNTITFNLFARPAENATKKCNEYETRMRNALKTYKRNKDALKTQSKMPDADKEHIEKMLQAWTAADNAQVEMKGSFQTLKTFNEDAPFTPRAYKVVVERNQLKTVQITKILAYLNVFNEFLVDLHYYQKTQKLVLYVLFGSNNLIRDLALVKEQAEKDAKPEQRVRVSTTKRDRTPQPNQAEKKKKCR